MMLSVVSGADSGEQSFAVLLKMGVECESVANFKPIHNGKARAIGKRPVFVFESNKDFPRRVPHRAIDRYDAQHRTAQQRSAGAYRGGVTGSKSNECQCFIQHIVARDKPNRFFVQAFEQQAGFRMVRIFCHCQRCPCSRIDKNFHRFLGRLLFRVP